VKVQICLKLTSKHHKSSWYGPGGFVGKVVELVAGVICIPVGAWLLNNWLKNYPQRIEFGADFILAPLILMILIAQFTVGYQTYKAAHSNPVNSLRNE